MKILDKNGIAVTYSEIADSAKLSLIDDEYKASIAVLSITNVIKNNNYTSWHNVLKHFLVPKLEDLLTLRDSQWIPRVVMTSDNDLMLERLAETRIIEMLKRAHPFIKVINGFIEARWTIKLDDD